MTVQSSFALWIEQSEPWSDAEFLSACGELAATLDAAVPVMAIPLAIVARNAEELAQLAKRERFHVVPWICLGDDAHATRSSIEALAHLVAHSFLLHRVDGRPIVMIESISGAALAAELTAGVRRVFSDAASGSALLGWAQWSSSHAPIPDGVDFFVDWVVVLHLYYAELWDELEVSLSQLPFTFDVFASVPPRLQPALAARARARFPRAVVFGTRNIGRDVAPFLHVLRSVGVERYRYVLKLHGKKSLHLGDSTLATVGSGADWRQSALSALLGSREHIRALVSWFDLNPDVGLIAPAGQLFDTKEWSPGTRDLLLHLGETLGMDLNPTDRFAAGTMFSARSEALRPWYEISERSLDFEREAGQTDATLHHAYERAFALISRARGFRVTDTAEAFSNTQQT